MTFPTEIVEKILFYCDGQTLFEARSVCKQWRLVVDYLSKKIPIWKWCCKEEIPNTELVQYLNNYRPDEEKKWFYIYRNWLSFKNMKDLVFETVLSPVEIPRITCIDVFEDLIVVGSEDGRVRIYNQYWRTLNIARHQAEKITKVSIFAGGVTHDMIKLVIAYQRSMVIAGLFRESSDEMIIEDVVAYSIFEDYICYQKYGGRLTIEKLKRDTTNPDGGRPLDEIWFARVYSPSNITCINMWNGTCTVLLDNDVRRVKYISKGIAPISGLPNKCLVNYSLANSASQNFQQILRDDIIIVLYRAEKPGDKEYLEVVMLDASSNQYAKKLFDTSEVLEGSITCIYLYGNTMVLGVDTGIVYFYHIPSWKHFTIKDYQRKLIIGKHPITNIVVQETKDKRKFFVTSSFDIHEVVGFCRDEEVGLVELSYENFFYVFNNKGATQLRPCGGTPGIQCHACFMLDVYTKFYVVMSSTLV